MKDSGVPLKGGGVSTPPDLRDAKRMWGTSKDCLAPQDIAVFSFKKKKKGFNGLQKCEGLRTASAELGGASCPCGTVSLRRSSAPSSPAGIAGEQEPSPSLAGASPLQQEPSLTLPHELDVSSSEFE